MRLDHVQLAMPPGREEAARSYWSGVVGLREVEKPSALRAAGGVWFEPGVHVGVEEAFAPARKAHPALAVADIDGLAGRVAAAGLPVEWDARIPGRRRFHSRDPFGNRVEFVAGA